MLKMDDSPPIWPYIVKLMVASAIYPLHTASIQTNDTFCALIDILVSIMAHLRPFFSIFCAFDIVHMVDNWCILTAGATTNVFIRSNNNQIERWVDDSSVFHVVGHLFEP